MTIEPISAAVSGRVEFLNPDGLNQNPAFSNVAVVSGRVRTIYVGGQDAVDTNGNVVGVGDIAAQTEQVLRNLKTALAAAGAGPEHVVKWNVLIVEGQDFAPGYAAFQRVWGTDPILRSSRPQLSRASPIPTSSSRWTRLLSSLHDLVCPGTRGGLQPQAAVPVAFGSPEFVAGCQPTTNRRSGATRALAGPSCDAPSVDQEVCQRGR